MKETIGDILERHVFSVKQPSPHSHTNKETRDKIFNQGWNACMAHLKSVGKI